MGSVCCRSHRVVLTRVAGAVDRGCLPRHVVKLAVHELLPHTEHIIRGTTGDLSRRTHASFRGRCIAECSLTWQRHMQAPRDGMDVREWLEATADRAPPDASTDPSIQDTAPHDARQPQRLSHRYRRKKKEADGESYILVPDRRKGRPPTTPSLRTPSPRRPRHAQVAESGSRCSSRSRSPDSDAPRERAHQYERRPRRKTRPDRYDHKPKKRQEERKSRRDQAPKRRKSNRTHDGSRTTGLVQSFQLKNGPKNNRLTVSLYLNLQGRPY